MMKTYLLFSLLLLYAGVQAQNKVTVTVDPGWSLYNSENALPMTAHQKFRWMPGLSVAYERGNVLGHTLHLEYNVTHRKLEGVMRFFQTSEQGPDIVGYYDADLALTMYNLDVDLHARLDDYFSVDLGPTFSCLSRTFSIDDFGSAYMSSIYRQSGFVDDLVSYGLGANGSLDLEVPLGSADKEHFFFLASLKARYVHSMWIDARGRNVDNYHQSILWGQVNVGAGYSF